MDTLNQSTSTSIAEQPEHNVEVTPKGLVIIGQYVLPHQLLPNPHAKSQPNHAMFEDWN